MAAETVKGFIENTTTSEMPSQDNAKSADYSNKTELRSSDTEGGGNTAYPIKNLDLLQKEEDKTIIPLRNE